MYHSTGEYIETEEETIPHQFQRDKSTCRLNIRGRNPHPSETEPRIRCQQYYPNYCKPKKVKLCEQPDPNNVIVNVGRNGDIEVSHIQGHELIKKSYKWNRLPPLQQPVSNNIPEYIQQTTWDSKYAKY